jgi:rhamnosyl/mannosyltransferase
MLLEAMMFAKPVICTSVGAMALVAQDGCTGMVVPPQDPEALAAAMSQLASSEELRRSMGRAGRRRYEDHFRADVMAEGVEGFFYNLLSVGDREGR